jgi:hypothetical protein
MVAMEKYHAIDQFSDKELFNITFVFFLGYQFFVFFPHYPTFDTLL